MMLILNEDTRIRLSSNNYILEAKNNDKWKRVGGYYSSLSQVLTGYIDYAVSSKISGKDNIDIKTLMKEIADLKKEVNEFLKF